MIDKINSLAPNVRCGKLLLAASAVAGFAVLFAQEPSSAASASYCRSYANEIAAHRVPTSATVAQQRLFRRIFTESYENCRSNLKGKTVEQRALAAPQVAAPTPDTKCNFSSYADPGKCDD